MRQSVFLSLLIVASAHTFAEPTNPTPNTANEAVIINNGQTDTQPTVEEQSIADQTINPLDNPDSFASRYEPSDNEFSKANQELLTNNAKLQHQVNDLETQVNVLVNERSGQLFLYGAFTVLISLLTGVFITWLILGRRERW